jgi:Ca2+-binding RTX toxin-like protein
MQNLILYAIIFLLSFTQARATEDEPIPVHTTENIFGSDSNDTLFGTAGNDEILGGYGDDVLAGNDGDDVLRGGDGNDILRGGDGDDVLYGGAGFDRLYGGLGADRFVFDINAMEADEVMDFNPDQNDTVWLQNKYTEMTTDTASSVLTADDVRVDDEGGVEVRIANSAWTRIVGLNQGNLHVSTREVTGALQLHFTRQF